MADRLLSILLVEDEVDFGNVLQQYLEINGFEVTLARTGEEGLGHFVKKTYSLCILDVMIPKMDGFRVAKIMKTARPGTPFLFLTARSAKEDRISGLRLGAADYICKPFEAEELILRIRNILSRSGDHPPSLLTIGRYQLNREQHKLTGPAGSFHVSRREVDILTILAKTPGTAIEKKKILEQIWNESDFFSARSLDVYISRLRKHLRHDPGISLETIHGVGYILTVADSP